MSALKHLLWCLRIPFACPVGGGVLATGIKGPFAHQDKAAIQSDTHGTYNAESHPVLLCTHMSQNNSRRRAAPVERSAGRDSRTG